MMLQKTFKSGIKWLFIANTDESNYILGENESRPYSLIIFRKVLLISFFS